jgi:putative hydrolase of the HAD superfamily
MTNPTLGIPAFDTALFDAGLTLIHPVRTTEKIYAGFAAQSGIPLPELVPRIRRQFRDLFERERREMALGADGYVWSDELDRQMWRRLCFAVADAIPGLTADPQAWFERLYDHFGARDTWQPFPETRQTLARLRTLGVRTAVVSNWDSRLHGILDALGITPLVDTVVVSATAGVRKPGAGIFELALARLDGAPARTVMVGDSLTDDVEGAARAGLTGVLVHRDRGPRPPGVPTIASLDELVPAS